MRKKGNLYFPTKEFKKRAWVKDKKIYQEANKNPVKFWEKLAKEIYWRKKWKKTFEHNPPYFKWFLDGKLNITENCLDRHIFDYSHGPIRIPERSPKGGARLGYSHAKNKVALIWEPEPIEERPRYLTYYELYRQVNKFANALKKLGVKKGDKVGIYLPMIPEAIISMLACARIGAVHTVVFSAFSPQALRIRLQDTEAKVLITADGYYRRGQIINLKRNADGGIKKTKVKKVIVVKRLARNASRSDASGAENKIPWNQRRDVWYEDLVKEESDFCKPEIMDSEDLLFILYTSGSTGRPKGTSHVCGGYTVQAKFTGKWIFDLHEEDIMWCVPPKTKVVANFNFKNISEIVPGHRILSHQGKFVEVLKVFKRHYEGDLIEIKTYYSNEPILLTPNHKILVSKDRVGPFEWMPASEIKKGYHVLFPIPKGAQGYKTTLLLNNFIRYKKLGYVIRDGKIFSSQKASHKISNKIKINEDFMRLSGYYLAEGSVDEDSVVFSFGKHEKVYIEDVKNLIKKIYGLEAKVKSSHEWAAPVYFNSRILSKFFAKLFGRGGPEKKLPSWFISLPNRLLSEFIKGFWRGDGNIFDTGVEFNTTSPTLAYQVKLILLKLGVIPSISVHKVDKEKIRYVEGRKFTYKHDIYRVTVTGTLLNKISKILEIDHPFLTQRTKTYHRGKITGNFLWTKVTSVNKKKYKGPVYNLKTESGTYTTTAFTVHNCTADVGWVTGHTYGVYSPLLNGVTSIMYEGAPDWPTPHRWAQIIEKYKVTTFYTAPTAIRMFEKYDGKIAKKYSFDSLQILGSVGEPIDEAAWNWYFKEVGKGKCPIVDTWWQTETGGILITSLPGIGPFKPAFTGLSFPGIKFDILDDKGKSQPPGKVGNLVLLPPFAPGLLRGIYKNPKKYLDTYWSQYGKEIYFTSDAAYRDKKGLIRIVGRVDDVIKVAGHRLTTGELEAAISKHEDITECAVVGLPDEIKGEVPAAFVVLKKLAEVKPLPTLKEEIIEQVKKEIGPIALPKKVFVVKDLPKTRSGKIMRRILRRLFTGEKLGDLSTLANPESVEKIRKIIKS